MEEQRWACPCCGMNIMDQSVMRIVELLQFVVRMAVRVTSGTRCKDYNHEVGGNLNSAHLTGKAIDIAPGDATERYKIISAAIALGIRRIGVAKDHIHLDVDDTKPTPALWVE